jgi:hypothetical protein
MRHEQVQRVSRAALEQADEDLSLARRLLELGGKRGAAEEAGAQAHRDQRECAGLHENAAFHGDLLPALEFG